MDSAWTPLLLSLKVAGWATFINLFLGVGVGFLLARVRFPGRDLLDSLLTLPMVMPPTPLMSISRSMWLNSVPISHDPSAWSAVTRQSK